MDEELITELPAPQSVTDIYLAAILQRLDIIAGIQATEAAARQDNDIETRQIRCMGGEIITIP